FSPPVASTSCAHRSGASFAVLDANDQSPVARLRRAALDEEDVALGDRDVEGELRVPDGARTAEEGRLSRRERGGSVDAHHRGERGRNPKVEDRRGRGPG